MTVAADVRWVTGFLDGPDRSAEGFWQAVTQSGLSGRRGVRAEFVTLLPRTGDAFLRAQVVRSPPARCHLDLHVGDVREQVGRAVGLGASVYRDDGELVVVRSPAGLVFCLVPWHGEASRPGAPRWPAGQRSLVDQMCLDVPAGGFDQEADFWSALTGWARRPGGLPEFHHLVRPDGMPLRLLLQRIGGDVAGMHVDLACDDVDAEVARHVGLGAVVVRRVPGDWTTLRDPTGREYCVTARSPA